jgi:tetratricopeptide (TPR) repeat protein
VMRFEGTLRKALAAAARRSAGSAAQSLTGALAAALVTIATLGGDPEVCSSAGQALAEAGFEHKALSCYSRAAALEPTNPLSWYSKGVLLYRLGRYDEAARSFQIAAESSAGEEWSSAVWYWRAQALIELADDEEAVACLEKALEINPDFADAWEAKGICFHYAGRYEDAVSCYDRAVWICKEHSSAWLNRGYALARLERHDEAMHSYDEALKQDPDCVDCWIGKGHVHEAYGRLEEAIMHYDHALRLDPECVDALVDKADCLEELGRHDEAERCLDEVVSLEVRDLDLLLSGPSPD